MTSRTTAHHIVDSYTEQYNPKCSSLPELSVGDTVLAPPHPDAREWAQFKVLLNEANLRMLYAQPAADGRDLYVLVPDED